MSTLNLTSNLTCTADSCLAPTNTSSLSTDITDMSLSSFEIFFVAFCSSFLTLIFAGLFNFLKINITQQRSSYTPHIKAINFDKIISQIKDSYLSLSEQRKQQSLLRSQTDSPLSSAFPPQNRYYPIVSSAFKLFVEAMNGTERDGWVYLGDKKGVKKYKKDIHASPFSLFRGEKILDYAQNVLIHAIRDKRIRLLVGDGQMRDCGALEVIDQNCKIEFEEYKSPAPFVGAREFVYIDTIHRLTDGTILSFARSVLHPKRPKSTKFTRADLKIGGWALQKIPDEPNKTKVVYLTRCDLGGAVPGWVINQITSDLPITVERLNQALKKFGNIEEFDQPLMDVLLYGPEPLTEEKEYDMKEDSAPVMGNGVPHSDSLFIPATESQKQRFAKIFSRHKTWWTSREYLDLIPTNDTQWFKRKPMLVNGTRIEHERLLDSFVIPDKPHKYSKDLKQALELFNKWRKWENGKEWVQKQVKEDMRIYAYSLPNESIDIIKGECVVPYSVPIICGVLMNGEHRRKWDNKMEEVIYVESCSAYTRVMYLSVKTPTIFITYRDMIAITFMYPFVDGSMIMGSRSIVHDKYPPKKTRVRANINLDIWHIRPHYDVNTAHSLVTHYAHVSLGGALPTWIVNEASTDMPSGILKVKKYISQIYPTLHKPGVLNIPPWPFLKSLGIDIGWMDRDPQNKLKYSYQSHSRSNSKSELISNAEETEQKSEPVIISNITNNGTNTPLIRSRSSGNNHSNMRSPAVNYVSENRQRKFSDNLSTTSSSLRRKKTPNFNLLRAQSLSYSQSQSSVTHTTKGEDTHTPQSPNINRNNKLILKKSEWDSENENGNNSAKISLRLKYIRCIGIQLSETDTCTDNNESETELKYNLESRLSVRDRASYMTLSNCAVSELLQQTDASSKEYWVPSETKTPRGIFVYKFIHSGERYYHYMGKAILHHEPSFIFEAICDPSFRYCYDKMLSEMQIIDKLDSETYIAKYSHTTAQCYIKQKREIVCVVRHRTVIPNDKYVAAGMSIEHRDYPTEIGLKYQAQSENKSEDSELLKSKGPSKSSDSGIIRIDIKSSGWVIERNVKKPSDSIVSYITNINFGGSLPSALLKTIAKKQPLAIFYLGKALKLRAKKLRRAKKKLMKQQHLQQLQQMQRQQQQSPQENA